jgi:hypothetical protein
MELLQMQGWAQCCCGHQPMYMNPHGVLLFINEPKSSLGR